MLKRLCLIFLIVFVCVFSWAENSENCLKVLDDKPNVVNPKSNLEVLSISYAPTIERDDGELHFLPHISLIERSVGGRTDQNSQILIPYYDPITLLLTPFQKFIHQLGLGAIYQAYDKLLDHLFLKLIEQTEDSLAKNRQLFLIIRKNNSRTNESNSKDVLGFFRVFDGSDYKSGPRAFSNYKTHLELILEKQGKSTTIIDQMRADGYSVFELGKYFIKDGISIGEIKFVRLETRKWLIKILQEYSSEDLKKTIFFAHVVSLGNQKRNEKDYGFKIVDRKYSSGLAEDENLMMINGYDLLQRLKELTKD